ncbi:hypothetical protein ACFO1B_04885 [Dactylosporangium siamense]|uniref:DNA-binding protein n=1 Tax=Dactylosporangium siamense TaxID=685454 RepID=A0A919U913_9ACTN|nr:hypothetical protein [Dactylosporangium siamense]GIG42776.1 DNA-binding protein [Dactylosporangium siamense]
MTADALLDAGAVLPSGAGVAQDTIDTLTTRAYRHPVLGERTVVRLVPGTLGPAEDLTMEFLGFAAPEAVTEVGVVRQQALGFPAWALVHDPANGHHALALVKDIERLVRIAKSRIGPARDGFVELGERLARSVPHFLPTFYEEAARAFLAADSPTYAASMFGKARDAERAFALKIDEDRQHTVFLEFALAGALTAKALSAYARDLAARADAATAYERFRRLCVERTLGGMPPYASMHTDLRRLAKAAKLGQDEEEALLRVLLTATSIVRAPGGFWTAYRAVLVSVARQDPAVRGQLLTMFPGNCPDETWLEILDESGATAALTGPAGAVPAEAESPDGPAGWLTRLDRHRSGWRRTRLAAQSALVTRMAQRLKDDGAPVDLCPSRGYLDLDVVDLCLELEIPLGEVATDASCGVEQWLKDDKPGRRDLVHVVAHPRLLPRIADSVEDHLRPGWRSTKVSPEDVAAVVAVPGLRTALHWWVDQLADSVIQQGLPGIDDQLGRLALIACPEGLAVNPEAVRRITGHDLGPSLAATLRAGVFDEYGWPALEAAVESLVGDADIESDDDTYDAKVRLQRQWPQLVVRAGDLVAVVGADEVELEHTLRIPTGQRHYDWSTVLRYVDGQLLVSWDVGEERAGYWSGTADDVFTTPDEAFGVNAHTSVALPGGGRTTGGRPLHAGDRSSHERARVSSDGQHYWTLAQTGADEAWRWHEYDVATGVLGRPSLPAFFEADAVDGQTLVVGSSQLLPAPPQAATSPLGHRDGLVGWRVRTTEGGTETGTGVDGRTFTMPEKFELRGRGHGQLVGAVRFPGADAVYGMVFQDAWRDNKIVLCAEDGTQIAVLRTNLKKDPFREGTRMLPPASYWHYLRVRDEAGSAALRAVTDEQTARLLAAVVDLVGPDAKIDGDTARKLVAEAFPEVSAAPLVAGIAGIVKQAARSTARLVELTTATAAMAAEPVQVDPDAHLPADRILNAALSGLIPGCYDYSHVGANLFIHVGAALLGREPERPIAPLAGRADPDWFDVVGALPAVIYRTVSPLISAQHHAHLLGLLEIIASSGLLAPGGRLRRLWLQADDLTALPAPGDVISAGERRLVVLRVDHSDGEVKAIEYAPDGAFGAVAGHAITRHTVLDPGGWDSDRLAAFVVAALQGGPLPWRPELVPALSAAAGITLADATVLLADPVTLKDWEERRPDGWHLGEVLTEAALEGALSDRDSLQRSERSALGAALLPNDPAGLWAGGPDVERAAAWHVQRYGVRTPLADDLVVEVRKAGITSGLQASAFLHGLANPETCRWLHGAVPGIGIPDLLRAVTRSIPWLVRRLPAGHPARVSLPRVLDLVRQRLADPQLELQIGTLYEENLTEFIAKIGLPVTVDGTTQDAGVYKIVYDRHWPSVMVRPALLAGPDDPRLAALLTALDSSPRFLVAMRAILNGQLDAWVEAAASTEGADEDHDPSRSAPDLVAEVAAKHGLGADAATLYLQLLALPDPTDRNVAAWTGWKPARLKKARAELAATDLVVEAKRARAGRSLFLPGGWVALSSPNLPFELWKLPLFIREGDNVTGLGAVIPVAPAPALFTVAWARTTGGDHPRFEELTTRGRR